MAGETGAAGLSLSLSMIIAAFFGISCYNAVEIAISIFYTFKKRRGLYFWSMCVATFGIPLHSITVLFRLYAVGPDFVMSVLNDLAWYFMVTGQAVVLYSRLHLLVHNTAELRWVLTMIITNFCILHIPTTVLFLGANSGNPDPFLGGFRVFERIHIIGFALQELIISGLYIYEAYKLARCLQPALAARGREESRVMSHLILVNALVVPLDLSLVLFEFTGFYVIEATMKPVVYSIKLKMEFIVLNKLVALVWHDHGCGSTYGQRGDSIPTHASYPLQSQSPGVESGSGASQSDAPRELQRPRDEADEQRVTLR
ncbi:hypothetical protein AUP68_08417 [Ilyonectria robusta]